MASSCRDFNKESKLNHMQYENWKKDHPVQDQKDISEVLSKVEPYNLGITVKFGQTFEFS